MKNNIFNFIKLKINEENTFSDLEKYALETLSTKLLADELENDEKMLLVNEFISGYLEFDEITDEPINETLKLEAMIDFLIQ